MEEFKIGDDLLIHGIDEDGDIKISVEDWCGEDFSWFISKDEVKELIGFLQKQLDK